MKNTITIFLLLLVSFTTNAQAEKLVGEWNIDFVSFNGDKVSGKDINAQKNIKKWLIAKNWPISNKDKTGQENITDAIDVIEELEEFFTTFIFRADLTFEINTSPNGILGLNIINGTYIYKENELTIKIVTNPNPLKYPVIKLKDNYLILRDIETNLLLHYKK